LLAIRASDPEATALLADAMNENVFVADYLLGRKPSPHHRDAVEYSAGSAEEAHNYAITAADSWKETPAAIAILRDLDIQGPDRSRRPG
jgi:hypothetical protein